MNAHVNQPRYVFCSGRSTLDMQSAKNHSVEELRCWLGDIKNAFFDMKDLSNTDCAVISGAFNRIESTLKYEHNISVPTSLIYTKPERRIAWLYQKLTN